MKVKSMIMNIVLGLVGGGAVGFALYKFVGCRTGACPITANPWTSILYGMILGLIVALPK